KLPLRPPRSFFFFLCRRRPHTFTLFPYTTLFRSVMLLLSPEDAESLCLRTVAAPGPAARIRGIRGGAPPGDRASEARLDDGGERGPGGGTPTTGPPGRRAPHDRRLHPRQQRTHPRMLREAAPGKADAAGKAGR